MITNSSYTGTKFLNYKLSSSYPTMRPLSSSNNWKTGFSAFDSKSCNNNFNKSWTNFNDKLNVDVGINSDLQPLTWLERRSIIDIDPLDFEDDRETDCRTPGEEDLVNPALSHAKVEIGSQENVHDFVRYAEMRHLAASGGKARSSGNNYEQPYQHSVNGHTKPNLSYTQLIFLAIETCRDRAMTVNDIYQWCELNYPYYRYVGSSWKNSLRHNLSINKSFRRMPREGQYGLVGMQGGPGRGAYWIVDEKERRTLIESLQRTTATSGSGSPHQHHAAHSQQPLTERNCLLPPSLSVLLQQATNGQCHTSGSGPFLRFGGHILAPAVSDENSVGPLPRQHHLPVDIDAPGTTSTDLSSSGGGEASIKLSNSCNSTYSRPPEDSCEPEICQSSSQEPASAPRVRSRRKTQHDKVRSIAEMDSVLRGDSESDHSVEGGHPSESGPATAAAAAAALAHRPPMDPAASGESSSVVVNVIVAPHFDHMYARYQHFLPPAIESAMDRLWSGGGNGSGRRNQHSVDEEEFLRRRRDRERGPDSVSSEDDDDKEDKGESTAVKKEPQLKVEPLDYDTDATEPMTLTPPLRPPAPTATTGSGNRRRRKQLRPGPTASSAPGRSFRPKRRRQRPLRIDERRLRQRRRAELTAVCVLAGGLSSRRQHQQHPQQHPHLQTVAATTSSIDPDRLDNLARLCVYLGLAP